MLSTDVKTVRRRVFFVPAHEQGKVVEGYIAHINYETKAITVFLDEPYAQGVNPHEMIASPELWDYIHESGEPASV